MESGISLYKRADGFVESTDGLFAVKMTKHTIETEDKFRFTFMPYFTADPMNLEWDKEQPFCLYPETIVKVLLEKGHGVIPSDEEIAPYLGEQTSEPAVAQEPEPTPTPTPVVNTPPAPAQKPEPPAPTPTPPSTPAATSEGSEGSSESGEE